MTDKNFNIKESTKMEDINVQARESIIKIANTISNAGNLIFFESVLFESTKSNLDLYEYVKNKKLKNWSLVKGAVSRAVNAGCMAWYLLIKADGCNLLELKSGTHNERLNKIQEALKKHKISMNKAYKAYKDSKNPEQEQEQEQEQGQEQGQEQCQEITFDSDSFNDKLLKLIAMYESKIDRVELYDILSNATDDFYKKLTKKEKQELKKIA